MKELKSRGESRTPCQTRVSRKLINKVSFSIKFHSDLQLEDIENIYDLYSQEEIDNFKCIFEMFDKEKFGFIDNTDLQTIMRSLGRDPLEANELIQNF